LGNRQREDLTGIDFVWIGDLILIGLINHRKANAPTIGGAGDAPQIIARLHHNALLGKGLGGEFFPLEGHFSAGDDAPIGG
jgi:hypothetical protein